MIILGIDPGTARTGYGVIRKIGNKYECLDYGVVKTSSKESLSYRLKEIHIGISAQIKYYKPSVIAIESIFLSKNVKSALTIGHTRGALLLTAELNDIPIYEYSPREVKQAATGYGNASKEQIQYMIQRIFNLKEIPKPNDAADALAIALCCGQNLIINSLGK